MNFKKNVENVFVWDEAKHAGLRAEYKFEAFNVARTGDTLCVYYVDDKDYIGWVALNYTENAFFCDAKQDCFATPVEVPHEFFVGDVAYTEADINAFNKQFKQNYLCKICVNDDDVKIKKIDIEAFLTRPRTVCYADLNKYDEAGFVREGNLKFECKGRVTFPGFTYYNGNNYEIINTIAAANELLKTQTGLNKPYVQDGMVCCYCFKENKDKMIEETKAEAEHLKKEKREAARAKFATYDEKTRKAMRTKLFNKIQKKLAEIAKIQAEIEELEIDLARI